MVQVYSSHKMTDISFVQALLESEDIEYSIENQHSTGIMPHLSNALGNIKIMIKNEDFEIARKIIDDNFKKKEKEKYFKVNEQLKNCPKCGSDNFVIRKLPSDEPNALMTFLTSVPTFKNKKYYQCNDCKSYWDIIK